MQAPLPQPQTAASVRCERCGAHYELTDLSAVVPCPFCGHHQSVSERHLEELGEYQAQVRAQEMLADEHAVYQQSWARWYGDDGKQQRASTLVFILVLLGCALLAAGGGSTLAALEIVRWDILPSIITIGGFLPAMVLYFGWAVWQSTRAGSGGAAEAGPMLVACPTCGAPGHLTPGDELDHCQHCRAPLVPTRAIMAQGLDAARAARRSAAMQRYRTERSAMANIYGRSAGDKVPYFVLGPFSLMLTVPTVMLTQETLLGETQTRPAGVALLWLFVLAMWGAMGSIFLYRKARIDRTADALEHLACQFHGARLTGVRATADWLNRFWAGPFPITDFYVGFSYGAAALSSNGFHCLLDYNPKKASHMRRRAALYVAAWVPGISEGGQSNLPPGGRKRLKRFAAESGWQVKLEEAGLVAEASQDTMGRLRNPQSLHEVAPLLPRLTQLAADLGCQPVEEIR